jgi:mevalonate kinase
LSSVEDFADAVGSLKEGVIYNPSADEITFLKEVYAGVNNPNVAQGMYAVSYLLTHLLPQSILDENNACISINVKSNGLPIGAGLGSSAAFSVALSAACCSLRKQILYPLESATSSAAAAVVPNLHQLEIINRWAFAAEVLLHGSPSGLDNTTSCFGGFVLFKRDMSSGGNIYERLSAGQLPLRLLLCNTGVPRSTKQLVGKVNSLKLCYPKVVEPIFSSIDAITAAFTEIMTAQAKEAESDSQGDCFAERISHVVSDATCSDRLPVI